MNPNDHSDLYIAPQNPPPGDPMDARDRRTAWLMIGTAALLTFAAYLRWYGWARFVEWFSGT
jgi:hypothetical protein